MNTGMISTAHATACRLVIFPESMGRHKMEEDLKATKKNRRIKEEGRIKGRTNEETRRKEDAEATKRKGRKRKDGLLQYFTAEEKRKRHLY